MTSVSNPTPFLRRTEISFPNPTYFQPSCNFSRLKLSWINPAQEWCLLRVTALVKHFFFKFIILTLGTGSECWKSLPCTCKPRFSISIQGSKVCTNFLDQRSGTNRCTLQLLSADMTEFHSKDDCLSSPSPLRTGNTRQLKAWYVQVSHWYLSLINN